MSGHNQEAVNEAVNKLALGEVVIVTTEGFGETATAGKEEDLEETATVGKRSRGDHSQSTSGRRHPITEQLGTPLSAQVYQIMGRPHG